MSQAFKVQGGTPMFGEIKAQRAKNAVLPMIAAALIPKTGQTVLHGVPDIADVRLALELAEIVGAKVDYDPETHVALIDASNVNTGLLPSEITERFRGSILFLGGLIARVGYIELPGSGGCDIGTRKIDFHHRGFARLGASVQYYEDGSTIIDAKDVNRLKGTLLYLDMPSHTGTENLMMGASVAEGTTIIENAAVEPEVVDFGNFLNKMGAKIQGLGTPTLIIEGVKELHAVEHTPIPDRMVVGLLMMSTAATGGDIVLHDVRPDHLRLVNAKLEQMGVVIDDLDGSFRIRRDRNTRLSPINITTHPFPGFPTDLQPCIAALSTLADGKSFIRERIFENRYDFTDGLISMGADIIISQNSVCIINGVERLRPANVRAASIRAGAALLLASLSADGESIIDNAYQIDRGHERIEDQLNQLGANVVRVTQQPEAQTTLQPVL